MRNFFYLLLLGVVLITIALVVRSGMFARKDPGRPINRAMREALAREGTPELSADDAALIRQKYPTAHRTASGLMWVVRSPGSDSMPRLGDELIVQYEGRLLNGTVFDSSYRSGAPLSFHVGLGTVIKGWDEAFITMHKGEKRTLIIPYWLAYGEVGHPPDIPPRATLVFDVELIDFR